MVAEMVEARWRILRLETIETGLFDIEIARQQARQETASPEKLLARAFGALALESKSLELVSRQQSAQHSEAQRYRPDAALRHDPRTNRRVLVPAARQRLATARLLDAPARSPFFCQV